MGERTEFEPGDTAPNNGHYIEVGEQTSHTNLLHPRKIELQRGQHFPETANHNRKWKKVKG